MNSYTLYKMKGNNTNSVNNELVYWYSQGSVDYTGANSGYPIGSILPIFKLMDNQ